jgi:hypothetical protein
MVTERSQLARKAADYQKSWFRDIRDRASKGQPLALVNADAPQEILRAMDIPYVVNQWWAAVIGAKGLAGKSLDVLRQQGYPDDSRQYDAVPLGSLALPPHEAPWGGLPQPTFAIAECSGDAGRKVFDLWDRQPGTEAFLFERSRPVVGQPDWWTLVPHRWEEVFGSPRLDLLVEECWQLVDFLERRTGRRLSLAKLTRVMERVNEQAEWNHRSRDLLASARPAPVGLHDSINSVMIPQWHRGTQWAVDQAKAFHDSVHSAITNGEAVCRGERTRLMWIGRGLWHDMAFYSRFQESHGAVFVWSMYLAIAADGYIRYGQDPMRALAARFAGLTDQLYMPGWAEPWYVKEAVSHGVDAAVHLVADDVPGSRLVTEALEREGIPVLEIRGSNADPRALTPEVLDAMVRRFLDERLP